jgi:hypothetical protein
MSELSPDEPSIATAGAARTAELARGGTEIKFRVAACSGRPVSLKIGGDSRAQEDVDMAGTQAQASASILLALMT